MSITAIIALLGVIAAPLVTWLVAVRRFSGKIESSDAKELWAESRSIRDWSQGRISSLEARVGTLEQTNSALAREKALLERQVETLTAQLEACQERLTELDKEINGRP